jgi:hypothetical protein
MSKGVPEVHLIPLSPDFYELFGSLKSRVYDLTSPYTSFNSWKHSVLVSFFQFYKKFHIDALLDFHLSH